MTSDDSRQAKRTAAIARTKALAESRADPGGAPTPAGPAAQKSSRPVRILIGGATLSAGLLLVGAMAAADRASTPPQPAVIERVVQVAIPASAASPGSEPVASTPPGASTPLTEAPTVVLTPAPRELPPPPADPIPAPEPTQAS